MPAGAIDRDRAPRSDRDPSSARCRRCRVLFSFIAAIESQHAGAVGKLADRGGAEPSRNGRVGLGLPCLPVIAADNGLDAGLPQARPRGSSGPRRTSDDCGSSRRGRRRCRSGCRRRVVRGGGRGCRPRHRTERSAPVQVRPSSDERTMQRRPPSGKSSVASETWV